MDVYDASRRRTGRVRRRGEAMKPGEYGLVVCVWVCDGAGHLLLTKRAPEKKSFPNTWENSGGSAWAGESSRQAIARELPLNWALQYGIPPASRNSIPSRWGDCVFGAVWISYGQIWRMIAGSLIFRSIRYNKLRKLKKAKK